jgi:hypothetical protein
MILAGVGMTRCESAGFTAGAVLAGFPRPPHTEGMVRGLPARITPS